MNESSHCKGMNFPYDISNKKLYVVTFELAMSQKAKVQNSINDYMILHAIVFIWGFTGIIGSSVKINAVNLVTYRTLIAFIGFTIWVLLKSKSGTLDQLSQKTKLQLTGIGLLVGLHWALFFAAVQAGSTSVGLLGVSTSALWTALLKPIYIKKSMSKLEVAMGLLVILGLYIVLKAEPSFNSGLVLSVLAGLVAANFSHLNGVYTRKVHYLQMAQYEMLGALIGCALIYTWVLEYFIPDFHPFEIPNLKDTFLILLLAGGCTLLPYGKSIELLKRISVFNANLAVNMEPIYGMALAALILGENKILSSHFYLGSAITILAVFANPLLQKFFKLH
jgi:drug/metabolite transporter (DMT)-like permease